MSRSEENTQSTKGKGGKKVSTIWKNATEYQNVRIIQKNLVYVIGLSANLANKEVSVV